MKISLIIVFVVSFTLISMPQVKKEMEIKECVYGSFIDNQLLYFSSNDDGENINYGLYSLNSLSMNKKYIDTNISNPRIIKISQNEIAYTNGKEVIGYNISTKKKVVIQKAREKFDIIGVIGAKTTDTIYTIQVDYKKPLVKLFIYSRSTQKYLYEEKIRVDPDEMEGVDPISYQIANEIVFSVQYNLYVLNTDSLKPRLITKRNNMFSINNDGVVYYQLDKAEKQSAWFFSFSTGLNTLINNNLVKDYLHFPEDYMYTSFRNGKYTAELLTEKKPYSFNTNKWEKVQAPIIYEDSKIQIKYVNGFKGVSLKIIN